MGRLANGSRRDSDHPGLGPSPRGGGGPGSNVALMIVGTPRSGTTLLQHAIADRGGFATIPETHMFTVFAPRILRTTRFPLEGAALRDALDAYVALPQHRGGSPAAGALFDRLGGRATSLVDVFVGVVAEMSGDAVRLVEKTPDHLLWVPHLAPVLRSTNFVAIVRDPRAVVASTRRVHWGQQNPVAAAERWSRDQRLVLRARLEFGDRRVMLVRYEDLVHDQVATVAGIAAFADHGADVDDGTPAADRAAVSGGGVRLDDVYRIHEQEWKSRVADPVTTDRIDAWRDVLTTHEVAVVERVCRAEMAVLGYERTPGANRTMSPLEHGHRLRYRARRVGHELRIRHSYVPRAGLRVSS